MAFGPTKPGMCRRINIFVRSLTGYFLEDERRSSRTLPGRQGIGARNLIFGHAPVDGRQNQVPVDMLAVLDGESDERFKDSFVQEMRLESKFDEPGVSGVVIVLLCFNAGIRQVLDLCLQPETLALPDDHFCQFNERELLGELVKNAVLTFIRL